MIFSLMKKDYPIIGLNINEEGNEDCSAIL